MDNLVATPTVAPTWDGIAPELLISQVRNTAPFLFEPDFAFDPTRSPFIARLRQGSVVRDFADLYRLNLSAHFASCATFVPTDVDNHIRQKFWQSALRLPTGEKEHTINAMVEIVREAAHWDVTPVSTRWVSSPEGEVLSGHKGEWFSVAAAAYAATRTLLPDLSAQIHTLIQEEQAREERIFTSIRNSRDGIKLLTSVAIIAHNLGDLNRVMDIWGLPPVPSTAAFDLVGRVYKEFMAHESHRHFPLREPRPLRRHQDLLLPTSPFLDGWGAKVARHPGLSEDDKAEVATALIEGWGRLNQALWKKEPHHPGIQGYARALSGLEGAFPGGPARLHKALSARHCRDLKAGKLRSQVAVSTGAFEAGLAKRANNAVK